MTSRVFSRIRSRINRDSTSDAKKSIDYGGPFTKKDLLTPQPRFTAVSPDNRNALFIKHLRLCSVTFDFHNEDTKQNIAKEMKRQLLLALVDHITTGKNWVNETVCAEILKMIAVNLFRDMTIPDADFDPQEDDPVLDPAWPHLQIVYEFLLRFMVSTRVNTKILKKYVDKRFLTNLIRLFASEDPRERDYLKTILHRVYGKFMSFRSFIRQTVNNVFYSFVYQSDAHPGIGELLEILGSIINGFAVPLKAEHRRFLWHVLIPMHKVKTSAFQPQLSYCATQFIEKDKAIAIDLIRGLLKYWPIQNATKQLVFLNELEEILTLSTIQHLQKIWLPLFQRIAKCIESAHFQISERALFLWNNQQIVNLSKDNMEGILPILYPSLARNSKHWNPTVHQLTYNVIRMFMDLNNTLFMEVSKKYEAQVEKETHERQESDAFWSALVVAHEKKQSKNYE